MKAKKMIMLTFIIVTSIISNTINAQSKQHLTPDERAKEETIRMKDKLNLTAEQEQKIAEINQRYANLRQELHQQETQSSNNDKQGDHKKMKELHLRKTTEFKSILNTEQFSQYLKMEEEMHKEHQH